MADETIIDQLERVRASGRTNMMDRQMVQMIAFEKNYHELVSAIESGGMSEYLNLLAEL